MLLCCSVTVWAPQLSAGDMLKAGDFNKQPFKNTAEVFPRMSPWTDMNVKMGFVILWRDKVIAAGEDSAGGRAVEEQWNEGSRVTVWTPARPCKCSWSLRRFCQHLWLVAVLPRCCFHSFLMCSMGGKYRRPNQRSAGKMPLTNINRR